MFVTAMAGNPLAVKLAADQGVTISWTDWAMATLVPGLVCLALVPVLLLWIARPQLRATPDATALAQRELAALTQYGIGSGPVMFGAGYVTHAEWWKAGFIMSVFYLVVWTTIGPLWRLAIGVIH
jgi:DASS family divalent anion:Na+ symporter